MAAQDESKTAIGHDFIPPAHLGSVVSFLVPSKRECLQREVWMMPKWLRLCSMWKAEATLHPSLVAILDLQGPHEWQRPVCL